MEKIAHQSVGIDISKDSFTCCICKRDDKMSLNFSKVSEFKNEKTGFNRFVKWVRKQTEKGVPMNYVMEATGVYYEPLAYHLNKLKQEVHVALPSKIKYYFKSLNVKTKTDINDARVIAQFGAERKLSVWQPPLPVLLSLRDLTRMYEQFQVQKTAFSNMLHSKEHSNEVNKFVLKSNKSIIFSIEKQLKKCEEEIQKLIASEDWLTEKVKKLTTIKGVGFMTVAIIVAETLGFEQFYNIKQVASFAGYDVVERQSGTSINGKSRISKKGNSHIRRALHFPALIAKRYNEDLKNTFNRIQDRTPHKMVGYVALQRKLLTLMFTLWKNDTEYIENYEANKKVAPCNQEATQDSEKITSLDVVEM
ncbi:MAG: IS110 family transposase [Crocinitomicaceae bacterium]|nr:IS110 family transposase [Crocinitomicaceae bacterium]